MNTRHLAASMAAAVALTIGVPALAQTTKETKVDVDHSMKDGVATTKTTTTKTTKHKTGQPKKVLGVKVGDKTATSKTTTETSRSSNGDMTTKTKTSH